jgi:hypothetical protein
MNLIPRVLRRVVSFAARRASEWRAGRRPQAQASRAASSSNGHLRQAHADEATIRHMAEEQLGGKSSAESREAYLRGEQPGGLHRGGPGSAAVKRGDEEDLIDGRGEPLPARFVTHR